MSYGEKFFNYNAAPYAPFWSLFAIGGAIKDIDDHYNEPIFDRERRAGVKYLIAESLERETMNIFRQICALKEPGELIVEGYDEARRNVALKKLLKITTKVGPTKWIKVQLIEGQDKLKIILKEKIPGCYEDTLNHFDKYNEHLEWHWKHNS